jgi:hypothetical protein
MVFNSLNQGLFIFLLPNTHTFVKYRIISEFSSKQPVNELLIKPGNLTPVFPYNLNCKKSFYSYENKPDCRTIID